MRSKSAVAVQTHGSGHADEGVPNFAFDPSDPWTRTFQAGLERAGLSGRRVYEVGLGSGANIVFMLQHCAAARVLGSDLDPRLPMLARQLVARVAPDLLDRFQPIEGSVSLIDTPIAMAEVATADVVVACLPQVPDPQDVMYARFHATQLNTQSPEQQAEDHLAHYYPWTAFNAYPFNAVGLGLIEALLGRVHTSAPRAEVVLNLGCRIGKDLLFRLFRAYNYRPEELASTIVRQHARTDISFFVALESAMRGTGLERDFVCEFYADPDGRQPISAGEAKLRQDAEPSLPVYHEICVLRGHPLAAPVRTLPIANSPTPSDNQ
jgi:SAM-dependent methyltransferase